MRVSRPHPLLIAATRRHRPLIGRDPMFRVRRVPNSVVGIEFGRFGAGARPQRFIVGRIIHHHIASSGFSCACRGFPQVDKECTSTWPQNDSDIRRTTACCVCPSPLLKDLFARGEAPSFLGLEGRHCEVAHLSSRYVLFAIFSTVIASCRKNWAFCACSTANDNKYRSPV